MKKLALILATGACIAFAVPSLAASPDVISGRVQIGHEDAQTTDFSSHRRWRHHRHGHWRHHYARQNHCWRVWRYGRPVLVCR